MNIIENIPNKDKFIKNISLYKNKLLLKKINNLNLDEITKNNILKKINEILNNMNPDNYI